MRLKSVAEILEEGWGENDNGSALRWLTSAFSEDIQGWGAGKEHFVFDIVKEITQPRLIIEVGSWKGKSAARFANLLPEDGRIICVDTWLGATEMIAAPAGTKRDLKVNLGYPQIYYQFLANMHYAGVAKKVVPFPQTSQNAARWMLKYGVKADAIYIDASHEYEDVIADLNAYSILLKSGGVMFGDDYCSHWSGVMKAVDEFYSRAGFHAKFQKFNYKNGPGEADSDYWMIRGL